MAESDPLLFPGKMDDKYVKLLPPTAMFTSEFDFCRRDAILFAERLKKHGKLLGIQDIPGCAHGYEMIRGVEEIKIADEEWVKAIDTWVRN